MISAPLQSDIGNRELPIRGLLRRKQGKFFLDSKFSFPFQLFQLFFVFLDLGTSLSYSRRELLAVVLLHRQHISILFLAITYTNRPLFGDSEAFNDKSKSDISAGQSKQLHKVSKASDFNAGGSRDFILHVYASLSSFYAVDDFGAI
jgi:hypothetical protein